MPFGLHRRSASSPSRSKLVRLSLERLEARELLSTSAVLWRDYGPYGGWATGLSNFTAAGKLLYFSGELAGDGQSSGLWRSDGTTAGTFELGSGEGWVNVGSTLFFARYASALPIGLLRSELWKTDGTPAGTMMVTDIAPQSMANVDGTLFFSANDGQLWRSDGTASGTTLVADLNAGQSPGQQLWALRDLTNVNGRLFFLAGPTSAPSAAHGNQLWESDGTPSGTHLVANLDSDGLNDYYDSFVALGNTLFFAENDQQKSELWRSDGTAAGTAVLHHFQADLGQSAVTDLVPVGNTLFFVGG
jgi:ELWxxDGT repeat protein